MVGVSYCLLAHGSIKQHHGIVADSGLGLILSTMMGLLASVTIFDSLGIIVKLFKVGSV